MTSYFIDHIAEQMTLQEEKDQLLAVEVDQKKSAKKSN